MARSAVAGAERQGGDFVGAEDARWARRRAARRPANSITQWTVLAAIALLVLVSGGQSSLGADDDLAVWGAAQDAFLVEDATGFEIPTAIAFVTDPGPAPDDPLYFVAELRGRVKVVTNDRSVHEFASVPTVQPAEDDLQGSSQSGLAGLCLDPDGGHVFATFAYPDEGGVLRNDVTRFDTPGPQFALAPDAELRFTDMLADFQSSAAHQIGGCRVDNGRVLVGVGDGGNAVAARDPEVLLGKVLCLTVEGEPCPENPGAGETGPARYVWATGFRNPFGLVVVDGELYVAENGIDVDRFLRARPGRDHLWDGSDTSIATGAEVVFDPAVSPVQLDYIPQDHAVLGDLWGGYFVFSVFNPHPATGVMGFPYDIEDRRPIGVPSYLLQHVGEGPQHMIATAVGPDGLYAAGAFPDDTGTSAVLRLAHDPANAHAVGIAREWGTPTNARVELLSGHSCINCHAIDGTGGGIGPSLDRFGINWRLQERLHTAEYEERIHALNASAGDAEAERVAAREAVLAVEGRERTRVWIEHFLQNPQFDNPDVQMPNPGLSVEEVLEIRDVLVPGGDRSFLRRAYGFARGNLRPLAVGFVGGFGACLALALLAGLIVRFRGSRRARALNAASGDLPDAAPGRPL